MIFFFFKSICQSYIEVSTPLAYLSCDSNSEKRDDVLVVPCFFHEVVSELFGIFFKNFDLYIFLLYVYQYFAYKHICTSHSCLLGPLELGLCTVLSHHMDTGN